MKPKFFLIVVGLLLVMYAYSSAQVPQMINYQGKLTNSAGAPIDTTVQMVFSICADSNGTTPLWTETQSSVTVDKGVFNVLLGSVNPIDYSVFDGNAKYLGVQVGGDPEITPRKPMVSMAYAYKSFQADTADYAEVAPAVPDSDWIIDGENTYHVDGYVGIGTTNPLEKLHVAGGFVRVNSGNDGILYLGSSTQNTAVVTNSSGLQFHHFSASPTAIMTLTSGGNVGIGTTSPNEQLEMTGNLRLPATTATTGIIKMGADRFIHNYGTANTFVGVDAGNLSMTGFNNTANGAWALSSNTTGTANTANGVSALDNNTIGVANTANGAGALFANTEGSANTANGWGALNYNTTGDDNTATGYMALYVNRGGNGNTATGYMALYYSTEGYFNTASGYHDLYSNTTGWGNTAIGGFALSANTTGTWNTAIGADALNANITGGSNTALGFGADVSSGDLANATAVGYNATVDASNKVVIGNTSVTSIGGQVDWTTFSDERYKRTVSENVPGLAFISKLKPVTYTMDVDAIDAAIRPPRKPVEGQNQENLSPSAEEIAARQAQSKIVYTGFIAQEVEQVAKELGYDFSGVDAPKSDQGMYGLRYAEFVVPLVKAVQEQQVMIQELQKRIEELEKK